MKNPFFYLGIILTILLLILAIKLIIPSEDLDYALLVKSLQAQASDFQEESFLNGVKSQSLLSLNDPSLNPNSLGSYSDLVLVQKGSLQAISPPNMIFSSTFGTLGDQDTGLGLRKEIIEYTSQSGDTVSSVAEKFDISLETLLWANNLTKKSKLKTGQTLVILPVSGVLHYVKKGETLSQIAKNYKGDLDKIVTFNELTSENDIYVGDILIIPDGVMPPVSSKQQRVASSLPQNQITLPSSYFILPLASPYSISQGLHWYNAVDLTHPGGNSCGRPVFAAAGGTVVRAKVGGWNGGSGNSISILHSDQVVTAYYHLGSVLVQPGQVVSTGEQIGTIGNTGKTTGCHLHFEVRGAVNPFAR